MALGATSKLTGTPREVRVGGAEGGGEDHRHTTGIILLVGTLSDKPPSSSTSPVAARKKKSSMLDVTNRSLLPPGAKPWACQPGVAWPTCLPRQTQPDLCEGPLNAPRCISYLVLVKKTPPLVISLKTHCGGISRLSQERELCFLES